MSKETPSPPDYEKLIKEQKLIKVEDHPEEDKEQLKENAPHCPRA